ncbi:MAG: hypothetical protein JO246_12345, partial [Frankiaceae bacterium]|nr:hypothetical protein [Frankiaceae bacterium]
SAYLATWLLAQLPDASLKKEWLPKIASGKARIAVGHPINPLVADAANAGLLLLAHEDEVHALKPDQVKLTPNRSIDQSRRLCKVNWKPSPSTRVCDARTGAAIWAGVIDRAGLAAAAQLLGLAQRMLDLGVDHAAQRKQFGKPIGSFQAVKHQLADVYVANSFARPVVARAAWSVATDQPSSWRDASHAKFAAGRAARLSARTALQVHAGIGYTYEHDLHMYLKRTWSLTSMWGDQAWHRTRVADAVLEEE